MIKPRSVNFVIYHKNCADGMGAAWAAWKLLGDRAEYFAAAHGDKPPDVTGKVVAILDFSYKRNVVKKLIKKAKSLIIIDHHKSAMLDLRNIPNTHFDMTHSGARLAWNFFHPRKKSPRIIDYIEDRDLWKWELPHSRAFSVALDMVPLEFKSFEKLENDEMFDSAIQHGEHILIYRNAIVKKMCSYASRRKLGGKNILVVNSSHWISEIGANLAPSCDFVMIWYRDHKKQITKVSLRSFHESVDVSIIARQFGGGGHKKAAGFILPGSVNIEDLFESKKQDDKTKTGVISQTKKKGSNGSTA